jgi:alkylation response protein AidB-like acyl-CoA dehydrogenase
MDLSLNESQKMLKSAARDYLKNECTWTAMKKLDQSDNGFSPELWRQIADMGWLGMIFPEAYGGMDSSLHDLAIIYEEMGQALVPGVFFSSSVLCGTIITEMGTAAQKQQYLPSISNGEVKFTLAMTEPDYGWGPECVGLSAVLKGDSFVLKGVKRFVHDAQIADQLICVARTSDDRDPSTGITVFLVDKNTPGISCRSLSGFTGEKLNEVTFSNVIVPATNILGEKDKGWSALVKPLNQSTAILCAYMVGGCQYLLDLTVQYAQTRIQFNQPIGAFQWVQGYIIEQANQLERARWTTNEAIWKLDANRPEREQSEAVSLAKTVASEAFLECGHLGHEVHAGIGVDKKYPLYLWSKKSKTLYSYLGDPNYHRKRIAGYLGL